jgi:nucleoside-diphosphate-sugar epimerase
MIKNELYFNDVKNASEISGISALYGKSVLVTGATGMICSCLIDILMYHNAYNSGNITIYATGRSIDRLKAKFISYEGSELLNFVEYDVCESIGFDIKTDYIIHGASNADPANMAKYPVETLKANVIGIDSLLQYGKTHDVSRVLYVSSSEMYGQPDETVADGFTEDFSGYVDYSNPRSCYPSGKRAAEVMCQSYISQYGMDIVIARPCHIYGPTMLKSDPRAISAFINNGVNKEDIVMNSTGELVRSHCYVADAASGILHVLVNGECGQAYNVADSRSICSIAQLATYIADIAGTKATFKQQTEAEQKSYIAKKHAILNTAKIEATGWKPLTHIEDGLKKTITILSQSK